MAVDLTEDALADVEKIFKSNRGDFSASALKVNQMAYCLNTGLPDVGMEIVVRLTENLTLGQSYVASGDSSTSYYFFPIESVNVPASKYIPLVGVSENKDYVSKVDDSTVAVLAGSGILRKADLTEHEVSWSAVPSFSVTVPEGELRWIVVKWNVGETSVEVSAEQYMPVTLDDFEQRLAIGRVWKENGVLEVSGRHILLSVDPYSSRTSWWQLPAGNRSVSVSYSTVDNGLLSLSAGELVRHPVVELATNHHVWEFPAFASVGSAWKHVQGSTGFVRISDNAVGDETDIRAIADYYDNGGTVTALPNNKFVAHLVGCYAGSNERVILFGQHIYDSMQEAEIGVESDEIAEAQWYSDLGQVSKIGWAILQKGTRDFSVATNAKFVPYSLLGGGASGGDRRALLGFRFSRVEIQGYGGGDVDLPYVTLPESNVTQVLQDYHGVVDTAAGTITAVQFQCGNNQSSTGIDVYIKINGVRTLVGNVPQGTTTATFVTDITVAFQDFVIFGFNAQSGSYPSPTISAYLRTAGA